MARSDTYDTHNAAGDGETVRATPARQGSRGVHVLIVLVVSFILAAAALFGAWWMKSGDLAKVEANNNGQPAEVQSFDRPLTPPKQGWNP